MKSHLHPDDPRPESGPTDANSLRGSEFRRLLGEPRTWLWIGGPTGALALWGLLRDPSSAWVLPALALAIGLGVVLWIADRNAANSFWEVYARTRGYELGGRTRLPETTPLLCEGTDRYATRTLEGRLAPGFFGTLALYTVEEEGIGLDGRRETSYHDFTLAAAEVPECAPYMSELYVQAKHGPRPLAKFADASRGRRRRVTLESEQLGKRFEIGVAKDQDEVWTRRLFSPTFVVWLAESAPRQLSVELVDGTPVAYVPGRVEDADGLDALGTVAGTVARRLLEESAQTSPEAR